MSEEREDLESRVEDIVTEGGEIRRRIGAVVVDAAEKEAGTEQGIRGLMRRILDAASAGIQKSMPKDSESVLREVVDGIGDGVSTAANATRLAFREAAGRGEAFAKEDVRKITDDLKSVSQDFSSTVGDAADRVSSLASTQANELKEHAKRTFQSMKPHLESALVAARDQPTQLAKESMEAGADLTRRATGSLLQALGGFLGEAGRVVKGEEKDPE